MKDEVILFTRCGCVCKELESVIDDRDPPSVPLSVNTITALIVHWSSAACIIHSWSPVHIVYSVTMTFCTQLGTSALYLNWGGSSIHTTLKSPIKTYTTCIQVCITFCYHSSIYYNATKWYLIDLDIYSKMGVSPRHALQMLSFQFESDSVGLFKLRSVKQLLWSCCKSHLVSISNKASLKSLWKIQKMQYVSLYFINSDRVCCINTHIFGPKLVVDHGKILKRPCGPNCLCL